MKLPNERYEYIKGEVVHLFLQYDVRCIPISGFELALKIGIKLWPFSSLSPTKRAKAIEVSNDGFYMDTGHEEIIFYNDLGISYDRMNMTLLHEIGHAVSGHTGEDELADEEEAEARFFAKYAAAPPPLVHQFQPSTPDDIADLFGLSSEAAGYAFCYYKKWLQYGKDYYLPYEQTLLSLFEVPA